MSFINRIFLFLLFAINALNLFGQKNITISGFVKDKSNGEAMPGVAIFNSENPKEGASTNVYGFYSLSLKSSRVKVIYFSIGFTKQEFTIDLKSDTIIDVALEEISVKGKEIVINAEKSDKNVKSADVGRLSLSVDKIKTLPAFVGEVDILKIIQLTPGVKNMGDGNAGFYVRGGGPDQNLILLDGAQVYNPFHLLGFFSVFNENSINNLELIKGGMPANYGGRLASVLDVSMKEGNNREYKVDGGIGLISSRITVQGPLKKDTSSFIFSARRSYADFVARPIINNVERAKPFRNSQIFFYDLNLKINYRLSKKDRIFLSGYLGQDKFVYNNNVSGFRVEVPWGNAISTFRWNHLFSRKLFCNTSVIFSDFKFQFIGKSDDFTAKLVSGIRDWNLKTDFEYFPNIRNRVKFGVHYTYHTFTPFNTSASQGDVVFDLGKPVKLFANELAFYAMDEVDVTDWLRINGGLRFSVFQQIGPFDRYVKNSLDQIIDTINYTQFQNIKTYQGFEPRISARISTGINSSIKVSYTRNLQFLHLASLSPLSLPTDLWIPSTSIIQPQIGDQYSMGFFKNFAEDMFETSVEVYYKQMKNQVEFKEGYLPEQSIKDNNDYAFTFGSGEAYGAEFFIKKKYGKFDGWIGYTWSKTLRTFADLNNGETYYAPFDRRHDASLVLSYKLNNKWMFGGVFVYGTGRPITLAQQRYFIENRITNDYGLRNSIRMAAYHRLDISATYYVKKTKRIESSWNFSVFNVYNRLNPFFIYFDYSGALTNNTLKVKAKQVSLFPAIPSVTWNFKF
jgi:hypothetical protein